MKVDPPVVDDIDWTPWSSRDPLVGQPAMAKNPCTQTLLLPGELKKREVERLHNWELGVPNLR